MTRIFLALVIGCGLASPAMAQFKSGGNQSQRAQEIATLEHRVANLRKQCKVANSSFDIIQAQLRTAPMQVAGVNNPLTLPATLPYYCNILTRTGMTATGPIAQEFARDQLFDIKRITTPAYWQNCYGRFEMWSLQGNPGMARGELVQAMGDVDFARGQVNGWYGSQIWLAQLRLNALRNFR